MYVTVFAQKQEHSIAYYLRQGRLWFSLRKKLKMLWMNFHESFCGRLGCMILWATID